MFCAMFDIILVIYSIIFTFLWYFVHGKSILKKCRDQSNINFILFIYYFCKLEHFSQIPNEMLFAEN